ARAARDFRWHLSNLTEAEARALWLDLREALVAFARTRLPRITPRALFAAYGVKPPRPLPLFPGWADAQVLATALLEKPEALPARLKEHIDDHGPLLLLSLLGMVDVLQGRTEAALQSYNLLLLGERAFLRPLAETEWRRRKGASLGGKRDTERAAAEGARTLAKVKQMVAAGIYGTKEIAEAVGISERHARRIIKKTSE
ncbi:hypothetical protein, partial [Pelomicrobium sp. G1]|uniref:hypothetical protein n=1 Tax=Pelomicrobium sp. G1 TaxID=3452920 RepID=UPI003F767943